MESDIPPFAEVRDIFEKPTVPEETVGALVRLVKAGTRDHAYLMTDPRSSG